MTDCFWPVKSVSGKGRAAGMDRGCRWLFAEVGARIGVHCHPHRFRHQFAFDLVESGVTIEVVADLMGHSTVDISRLYYQASDRRLREAMRARGRRRR